MWNQVTTTFFMQLNLTCYKPKTDYYSFCKMIQSLMVITK